MQILNLADQKLSQVGFTTTAFPDGQQQIKITYIKRGEAVLIKSRMNNFMDLEKIVCAVKSINGWGINEVHLFVPYFLGSRSDRKFSEGENNYLKDVICPIVNSLKLSSVKILDPHSDILEACLDNFQKTNNHGLVKWALGKIDNKIGAQERIVFISPDGGALKKIYDVALAVQMTGEIITCSKHRDASGAITKTIVPEYDLAKDAVVIDDICDGGKTFIEIAKIIRDRQLTESKKTRLFLIVTHGIFSKGTEELFQYFDEIFSTNSYKEINEITQYSVF